MGSGGGFAGCAVDSAHNTVPRISNTKHHADSRSDGATSHHDRQGYGDRIDTDDETFGQCERPDAGNRNPRCAGDAARAKHRGPMNFALEIRRGVVS